MKLPHTEVKSQTGLSSLWVSCERVLILLDPRKHITVDFNNAKDIFVRIQFVTID